MCRVKQEDIDLVTALKSSRSIKTTAANLRVTRKTVYNRMESIKRRYKDAKHFSNWLDANVRDDEWLRERLKPKVTMD